MATYRFPRRLRSLPAVPPEIAIAGWFVEQLDHFVPQPERVTIGRFGVGQLAGLLQLISPPAMVQHGLDRRVPAVAQLRGGVGRRIFVRFGGIPDS